MCILVFLEWEVSLQKCEKLDRALSWAVNLWSDAIKAFHSGRRKVDGTFCISCHLFSGIFTFSIFFIALSHFYLPAFLTFSTSWRPRCTGLSFLHVSRRRAQMGGNIIIIIIINNIALHHHHHHHILILMCDCDMLHIKRSTAAFLCLVRWCILCCLAPKILSWKLYFNLWEDNSIVLMEVQSSLGRRQSD